MNRIIHKIVDDIEITIDYDKCNITSGEYIARLKPHQMKYLMDFINPLWGCSHAYHCEYSDTIRISYNPDVGRGFTIDLHKRCKHSQKYYYSFKFYFTHDFMKS
jgi:hypothetical protein